MCVCVEGGGVGGGWMRNLPLANISKTIRCMPMKFSQVGRIVKLNVC